MMTRPMATAALRTRARQSRRESRERIVAAATELVRTRAYSELSVDAVMREAGMGRTIFYRHFDDLGQMILSASREAIEQLYQAQEDLGQARPDQDPAAVRRALTAAVDVYHRHGPLLRAVDEAAPSDEQIRHDYEVLRRRFDDFVERSLREVADLGSTPPANLAETARALNFMGVSYLLDAFGREPRVTPETAVQTLTEIWDAVISR
jgi:TetR/AcrR family transcriptional regulator, ethionamide resistance regulator